VLLKAIKLTATARADVQSARECALLDVEISHRGSDIVQYMETLLSDSLLWQKSASEPVAIERYHAYERAFAKDFQGLLVLYQDSLYDVRGQVTDDQRRLLVLQAADKERQLFERLKAKFDSPASNTDKPKRERIPEAVRIAVWRRDQARCGRCGSRERLEYDHIVPIDLGGSNTARNIELLCEHCNRSKSNSIQ
jgi:hypothetical protein